MPQTTLADQPVAADRVSVLVTPGFSFVAAYVDGALSTSGDLDEALDRVLEILGVDVEHDTTEFWQGGQHGGVAPTLDTVSDWPAEVERRYEVVAAENDRRQAGQGSVVAQKRAQAAALLAEADEMGAGR